MQNNDSLFDRVGGNAVVQEIVNVFYNKMLDDHRVKRYFNNEGATKHKATMMSIISAVCSTGKTGIDWEDKLNDFFITCFGRNVGEGNGMGSDYGFLGMIISQDIPSTKRLCRAHAYLLKFIPDNSHYDVVIEHLNATLQTLNIDKQLGSEVLAFAESGRNPILGI